MENIKKCGESVSALDSFMGAVAEIRAVLAELSGFAEDHFGVAPDAVSWADVGSAERVRSDLSALCDCLLRRGEYAE